MRGILDDLEARRRVLEEPLRAYRDFERELGASRLAAVEYERNIGATHIASEQFNRARAEALLASEQFDRDLTSARLAAVEFDRWRIEERDRLQLFDQLRLYDPELIRPQASAAAQFFREQELLLQAAGLGSVWEQSLRAAEFASGLALPDTLSAFRASQEMFALRLTQTRALDHWREPAYLSAFAEANALANLFAESSRADSELFAANREMMLAAVPDLSGVSEYRQFLDASGLILTRMPRVRLLTLADKRHRIRNRLRQNGPPAHVKRARTLVHKYELTLRESIDAAMADAYGEDWALERLARCGCKSLLGKWLKRGGDLFEHADYPDYAAIMCFHEHFEAAFARGFDDSEDLRNLINQARRLRAASHHPHEFTQEDLRSLRVTWRTIEIGLAALIEDFEIESWA